MLPRLRLSHRGRCSVSTGNETQVRPVVKGAGSLCQWRVRLAERSAATVHREIPGSDQPPRQGKSDRSSGAIQTRAPHRPAFGLRGNPGWCWRRGSRLGCLIAYSIVSMQVILPSSKFGSNEFLHAGPGGVDGIQMHLELSGDGWARQAFESHESEGIPRLRLHAPLHAQHAGVEQIEELQLFKFFLEVRNLVLALPVFFNELRSRESSFAGVGFAKAPPGDCPEPCSKTTGPGMPEILYFGQHHQHGIVSEVFSVCGLQPFPPRPLAENRGRSRGKYGPRLVIARLDATQHSQRGVELESLQCRPRIPRCHPC